MRTLVPDAPPRVPRTAKRAAARKLVVATTFGIHPARHGGQSRVLHFYGHLYPDFETTIVSFGPASGDSFDREIAEILSISVSAVETLIFRARRALREQLEGSLSCREAELAVSRQLDGRLPRADKAALRAHLRTCSDCASFARSQRAQRAALKGLATIPVPASLGSFFGGGAAVGTTVAVKAAVSTMPSRTTVLKPGSVNDTLYSPGGRAMTRY